jgi:hypothetical protein
MYCPKCGAENADDAAFCKACGNSLKASAAPGPSGASPAGFSFGPIPSGPATFQMGTAFANAINLVKNPVAFMTQNKETVVPLNTIIIGYVAILAVVPLVATLIGDLWYYAYLGAYGSSVALAVVRYVLDVVAVYVIGFVIWKLGPSFGTTVDQARATLLAAFVYTPVFLISIVNIIPYIGGLEILGLLYGLYILYLGLPILLKTANDKVVSYVIAIVVVSLVVYLVIGAIVGGVSAALFLRGFFYP